MQNQPFESRLSKRSHLFLHALIVSTALNLGLVTHFITSFVRETKIELSPLYKKEPPASPFADLLTPSNEAVLEIFESLPFDALLEELRNDTLVEQGYRKRDLALVCLAYYHDFDIERALPGIELQKRPFIYKGKQIKLIPGVDLEHFQAIDQFAKVERWPLTPKGLFKAMQRQKGEVPLSLMQTFFVSKEFYLIERAFKRFAPNMSRETILNLLLEGSWDLIVKTASDIQESPSGRIADIASFLSHFETSKLAAYLLIALEPDYPFKKMSNERLKRLIDLLDQKNKHVETFLRKVASSLRPDQIRNLALLKTESQVSCFAVNDEITVKRGDSLWSLSVQYHTTVDRLRSLNHLSSDRLFPGQTLKLPQNAREIDP